MEVPKIAVIGCGNLGLAIVEGLIDNNDIPNKNITATRRSLPKIQHLVAKDVNVTDKNELAVKEAKIVILTVKPYNLLTIAKELKADLAPGTVIVSTATGVSIQEIADAIGTDFSIVRAMPNTAAEVRESLTCICDNGVSKEDYQLVEMLFNSIGKSIRIQEDLMDAATVLGACGIAYVLRFMRAMVQGGIQIGFDAKTASAIVNQTVKGAAELLTVNGHHPEYEIDKVTTPKGCTIVGINEMEHNGFSSSLIKGIVASHDKIEEI
ncbi:pyrroline-5-carboxylate reductase [Paracrocinitomix mangrovi]|uniref:pyrroline-5-carboxylate reductase n=1 Tax=Paracrocinitomix mangrovi TaxID=2862509 RepID=UPI001C8DEE1A|nr:pyrroline-5-carboxylate reductase [Paracrocinitomix mangrovi]UKN02593.1 pyrroline-5-carboxylate reductase [Paracrocinitomix mangrovi]